MGYRISNDGQQKHICLQTWNCSLERIWGHGLGVCLYLCICSCVLLDMNLFACVYALEQRLTSSIFPNLFHIKLTSLARMLASKSLGSSCIYLFCARIKNADCHTWLLHGSVAQTLTTRTSLPPFLYSLSHGF